LAATINTNATTASVANTTGFYQSAEIANTTGYASLTAQNAQNQDAATNQILAELGQLNGASFGSEAAGS
jgi:hypothetical protein